MTGHTIRKVLQKNNNDCGIASLAMVLGVTYKTASKLISIKKTGINWIEMIRYTWMLEPKLSKTLPRGKGLYLVSMDWHHKPTGETGGHWIVMDGKRNVYDPMDKGGYIKKWGDYPRCCTRKIKEIIKFGKEFKKNKKWFQHRF